MNANFWGARFWGSIGAVAGIAAVVVALVQLTENPQPPAAPTVQISGNCNAAGTGITVAC